jgi:hypothetical protein
MLSPENGELRSTAPVDVPSPDFDEALRRVNEYLPARTAYLAGQAAAAVLCGSDGCPPTKYAINVTREVLEPATDGDIYRWNVTGKAPTTLEWQAFMRVYANPSAECAPFVPLITLTNFPPIAALLEKTQALTPTGVDTKSAPARTETKGAEHVESADSATSMGEAVITASGNCVGPHQACYACQLAPPPNTVTGWWKKVGGSYCCRSSC